MKKKLIALTLCLLMVGGLCACNAEEVNNTINGAMKNAGMTTEINIQQEDLDKATDAIKKGADTVKNVVEDEDVKKAVGSVVNAVKDASRETKSKDVEETE